MPKHSIGTVEPPLPPPPELITPDEARKIIGVISKRDMYRRINTGRFPKPIKISRGALRFVRAECHAFVQKLIAERDALEAERAKYDA